MIGMFYGLGMWELIIILAIGLVVLVIPAVVLVLLLLANRTSATKEHLTACPDCGHMVSRSAKHCPECGRPMSVVGSPT